MSDVSLGDIVEKVRSKNAGPFWLTVDIFCGDGARFDRVSKALKTRAIAAAVGADQQLVKRFDIAELHVVKFSFPRPQIQGSRRDRDMHGAAIGALIAELRL